MKDIEIISQKEVKNPKQVKVVELTYKENGDIKQKECLKVLDVVKILIYNKDRDAFVITKQFRPLVYVNHPECAVRYELCGGREDKNIGSYQTAIEEVLEETGYKVDKLEKITTLYTGGKMTLYYAEVDESMRVNSGGGVDYENISVEYLPVSKAKEFMFDESKPKRPGLMFTFCWFFETKKKNMV